jgi:hypothetical protein
MNKGERKGTITTIKNEQWTKKRITTISISENEQRK